MGQVVIKHGTYAPESLDPGEFAVDVLNGVVYVGFDAGVYAVAMAATVAAAYQPLDAQLTSLAQPPEQTRRRS